MLNHDVLFLVFLELSIRDTRCVRQTYEVCRSFNLVTHTRSLWLTRLRRLIANKVPVPCYVENYEQLDTSTLEYLVHRMTFEPTNGEGTYPATLAKFNLALSVTWLRLVAGNWLFVAASNNCESKLSCYDLSDPSTSGTAHVYLPSRVTTGKAEIQNGEIIVALGLEAQIVLIVTLSKHNDNNVIRELARLERSSHVLMLSGAFVGCGARDGVNVPHLYRWRDDTILAIEPPPGGLDVPSRRSVPHSMVTWGTKLIIVRSHCIELYDMVQQTISFSSIIETSSISEVAACPSSSNLSHPLQLVALSAQGIDVISLTSGHKGEVSLTRETLVQPPVPPRIPESEFFSGQPEIEHPLMYGLCVGASCQRMLWISAGNAAVRFFRHPLQIFQRSIEPHPDEPSSGIAIFGDLEDPDTPALYGLGILDFDEVLGLMVIGDCFGDVTVFDFSTPKNYVAYPRLTADMAKPYGSFVSALPSNPVPTASKTKWGQDHLDLDSSWKVAHPDIILGSVWHWHGVPGDFAWLVQNMLGFPGEVILQAYRFDTESESEELGTDVILRVGQRYLGYSSHQEPHWYSWPLGTTDFDILPGHGASAQAPTCETASAIKAMFHWFIFIELSGDAWPPFNRWKKLRGRGGKIPGIPDHEPI
ncbi:hypothetical protein MIND_01195600 [Mycena indigotica]|uniref:F-box domain-containing protein n=1 Tax=Mycena indigotica TaxID=2126181 RepID=A0A8H6VT52_9AGAR|nr:uncharacterized protein MIND_01195600 [Mycena indigotica]KAF7292964.1 hypothetical protein MIND_01195600 [Mycena indigotica]